MKTLAALPIVGLALLCGCETQGVCVSETLCTARYGEDLCTRDGKGFFVPAKDDAQVVITTCGMNGYAFDTPADRENFLRRMQAGERAVGIGWTSKEIERRKAAGVCVPQERGCKPWTPEAHKSIARPVDVSGGK